MKRFAPLLVGCALLAGCVTPQRQVAAPSQPAAPTYSTAGLSEVLGHNATDLIRHFGQPALDIRERDARKLQFSGPACVLDVYLYPRGGREALATHVDARLPDGRDMDRASCVAALEQARR